MVHFRLLTEQDAAVFQALRLRALQESPDAFATTSDEFRQETLASIAERLQLEGDRPERFVLGAFEEEGRLIGIVGLMRETMSKMRHKAIIWGMYVAPEGRGQGIGKQLLQELLKRCAALPGLEQVHLSVIITNEAARHLYTSTGFQVYGREPHAFKQGEQYLDEELMLFSFADNRSILDV